MVKRTIGVGMLLAGWATAALAQDAPPRAAPPDGGIVVDTLDVGAPQPWQLRPFILPGSEHLRLDGAPLDSTAYRLDARYGTLWLLRSVPDSTSRLVVRYRTFPYPFRDVYYRRRILPLDPDSVEMVRLEETGPALEEPADLLGDAQIERRGSITRGIIAGNNRDVALESGLRLELAGEVTEGVTVQAVLTDENTPIQPDGTTQRLNEFDRVFIQLQARQGTATLGDYDLRLRQTEFAPFNRKLQGISLSGRIPDPPGRAIGPGAVTVAGATARGLFNAQQIQPLDGVQGPYRLEGREGERFIIVIAGSERVYLDGRLLTRGETNDYVIDYATGEITFTSRRLIAEDSRINVEFEYSTNRFTRALLGAQAEAQFFQREDGPARFRFGTTVLRESDGRSFGQELGLSPSDEALLELVGDSTAGVPGGEPVRFDPEAPYVQYVQRDTLGQRIFVPLTDTTAVDTVYRVSFTRVPQGQGNYRRVGRAVNGILFEWVGDGRGDYRAERLLPRPRLQDQVDFTGVFEPIRGLEVYGEWSQSVVDANRVSPIDDDDNVGAALLGGVRLRPTPVVVRGRSVGRLSGDLRRRSTGAAFEAFDRIRPVEFGRKWNLTRPVAATTGVAGGGREQITEAVVDWEADAASGVRAEWGALDLADGFAGQRVALDARATRPGWPQAAYAIESVDSRDEVQAEAGTWLRQLGIVRQPLAQSRVTPFLEVEHEDRRLRVLGRDSLLRPSLEFVEWRPGVEIAAERLTLRGSVERRVEWGAFDGRISNRAEAWTGQAGLAWRAGPNFNTEAELGWRRRRYAEKFRIGQNLRDNSSIAVRWEGRLARLRRAVTTNWIYDALTERTPLLQETFVLTGPEIGTFVWEDANADGIRQIDEFIPERLPNEGLYSRTFVPSDTLEPVINVQARLNVGLDPRRLFGDEATGWRRWASAVTSQTTFEVREKSRQEVLRRIYLLNLYYFDSATNTVNGLLVFRQRLEAFRGRPYGLTALYLNRGSTAQRAAGFERQGGENLRLEGRVRVARRYGFRLRAEREEKSSESRDRETGVASASRTFDIHSLAVQPEASVQFGRGWQVTTAFEWGRKTDTRPGRPDRRAVLTKWPVEVRYSVASRLQSFARVEWADVRLDGEAVGLAEYELTDGRGPGTSFLWSLSAQYQFTSMVQGSLSYDGRAPSDAPVLHTVRMQFGLRF